MDFKNGVIVIQNVGYNGAPTVFQPLNVHASTTLGPYKEF